MRVRSGRDGDRQESGERRNTPAQQTSGLQQWVDRSPKVRAQEQLIQRTVPTHSPAAGVHTTAPAPQSKLVGDRLNIVGENHLESNSRRPLEQEYNQFTLPKSDYWLENKFIIPVEDDKILMGDPPYLRFYTCFCLLENFDRVDGLPSPEEKVAIRTKMKNNFQNLAQANFEYSVAIASLDIYSEDQNDSGDHFQIAQIIQPELPALFYDLRRVESLLNELDSHRGKGEVEGAEDKEFIEELNEVFEDFRTTVKLTLKAFRNKRLDPFQNHLAIARLRSFAMAHAAAHPSAPKRGVWKVGQFHVDDMRELPSTTFNLVDLAVYNEELARFKRWKIQLALWMLSAGGASGSMGSTEPTP